jgi:hypothetical protein
MPDEFGNRARIVICSPATMPAFFPDDVLGNCALCHRAVRFRPHVPARRVLICLECFIVHAEPGAEVEITDETAAELQTIGWHVQKC